MARRAEARAVNPAELKGEGQRRPKREKLKTTQREADKISVGKKIEERTADGSVVELVVADQGEGYNVLNAPDVGTAIRPEGHAEIREKTAVDMTDLKKTYEQLLEATLRAQAVPAERAQRIIKAAEAQKILNLLEAAGQDSANDAINQKIDALLRMTDQELLLAAAAPSLLQIESAARKAEVDLVEATTLEAMHKADRGVYLSAYEAALRRAALKEAAGEKPETAKEIAKAEGFIDVSYSPLYEEGADATKARIKAIENEMRKIDAIPDNQRTAGAEIHHNKLWTERKKHMAVLPMLEKMKALSDAIADIDNRKNEAIDNHRAEVKAEIQKIARKRGAYSANIAKKNAILKAREGFMDFWKGFPWAEEAAEDHRVAEAKLEEFENKRDELIEQAEYLEEQGVLLDFDPSAEKAAAQAELHDYLIGLTRDGEVDGVKEFIDLMLKKSGTTDVERTVLEQTLEEVAPVTHPLFKKGEQIYVELDEDTEMEGVIVGFTMDGKVKVDLGTGEILTYDDEMVTGKIEGRVGSEMILDGSKRRFLGAKYKQYEARYQRLSKDVLYHAPEDIVFWSSFYDALMKRQAVATLLEDGVLNKTEFRQLVDENGWSQEDSRTEMRNYAFENAWHVIEAYNNGRMEEVTDSEPVEKRAPVVTKEAAPIQTDTEEGSSWNFAWEDAYQSEPQTVSQAEIDACAKDLGIGTEELDGVKASFELVKTMLRINELKGGAGISMQTLQLPETWDGFVRLQKKAEQGFFKKLLGGKSETQKAMGALAEAYSSQLAEPSKDLSANIQDKIQQIRDRVKEKAGTVFHISMK